MPPESHLFVPFNPWKKKRQCCWTVSPTRLHRRWSRASRNWKTVTENCIYDTKFFERSDIYIQIYTLWTHAWTANGATSSVDYAELEAEGKIWAKLDRRVHLFLFLLAGLFAVWIVVAGHSRLRSLVSLHCDSHLQWTVCQCIHSCSIQEVIFIAELKKVT